MPPSSMLFWHIGYFELKLPKKQQEQAGYSETALFL